MHVVAAGLQDSDMKEKFEAFTTKASKDRAVVKMWILGFCYFCLLVQESEDNKRKMDEKSGELDKVVNGFTSDFKDFKVRVTWVTWVTCDCLVVLDSDELKGK